MEGNKTEEKIRELEMELEKLCCNIPAADACNNASVIQIYDRAVIAHTAV